MKIRLRLTDLICAISAALVCLSGAQTGNAQTINVMKARIGCLDIQKDGNLTGAVANACNRKTSCSYKAPTPQEYARLGVHAATRTFCTQGMEITYQCGNRPAKDVSVPGDAWNHPPAELVCEPTPPPPASLSHPGAPLKGFVDLHTHPLSNLGFGGKLVYGGVDVGALLPADPDCHHNVRATDVQQALGHDKSTHGGHDFFSNSCGDEIRKAVIHGLQTANKGADPSEDAHGYPDFNDWPTWNDITHQKMWVDWIRRAYVGGLRVMVALAVNNKTLGDSTAGPGDGPTEDKASADLQIAETKAFVGRHSDFMEVAYTSADLQRIIGSNKLAVVLGIEIDNIGNLHRVNPLTPAAISAEIDRLYAEGVRYIFPIHVIDNAFGGTAAYLGTFNISNYREAGHFWNLECAKPGDQITYKYQPDGFDIAMAAVKATKLGIDIFRNPPTPPSCPASGHENAQGLTDHGEFAIKEMMRHGMLIDIDHMSQKSLNHALDIAEQVPGHYPLNSGHSGLRGLFGGNSERSLSSAQYHRISNLHGMAGVGSADADAYTWVQAYNAVLQAMGNNAVAAFGTDTNGLAMGMPTSTEQDQLVQNPKYAGCVAQFECSSDLTKSALAICKSKAAATCGKQYPPIKRCLSNCGHPPIQYSNSFPVSSLGTHTWDYNVAGVAHYGMLPDFLHAVRNAPGGANLVDNNLMNGAEYFFQTWEKCEALKTSIK